MSIQAIWASQLQIEDAATATNQTLGILVPENFDYIGADYPSTDTEIYTYKQGGNAGTIVATVTVVYTTSSKDFVHSVERT